MINNLKQTIEHELKSFLEEAEACRSLRLQSPVLFDRIKEFVLRKGKRIRPVLFVVGYLGYSERPAVNFKKCAIAFELLHDFMLIHDDIIDRAETRRGKPSMQAAFSPYLKKNGTVACTGQDLALLAGDMFYALAFHAFISISETFDKKEEALGHFINTAILTGSGQFNELMTGMQDIETITREDLYSIYDLKTAYYTFASPLRIGVLLGGGNKKQQDMLFEFGVLLGRAFQIRDDIADMFGENGGAANGMPEDFKARKRTFLLWCAYKNAAVKERHMIREMLSKKVLVKDDFLKMQRIIVETKGLEEASKEIMELVSRARENVHCCTMKKQYKDSLLDHVGQLLAAQTHTVFHHGEKISAMNPGGMF